MRDSRGQSTAGIVGWAWVRFRPVNTNTIIINTTSNEVQREGDRRLWESVTDGRSWPNWEVIWRDDLLGAGDVQIARATDGGIRECLLVPRHCLFGVNMVEASQGEVQEVMIKLRNERMPIGDPVPKYDVRIAAHGTLTIPNAKRYTRQPIVDCVILAQTARTWNDYFDDLWEWIGRP